MKTNVQNPIFFPPEWHPQDRVQMAWPDVHTDWETILPEVRECYLEIATHIMDLVPLMLLCKDRVETLQHFKEKDTSNLILVELPYNDTWARDYGGITVFKNGQPVVYDFTFNGWGLKYAANYDNNTNRLLEKHGMFEENLLFNRKNLILEGGSIETDGEGTLMTTTSCLLSAHRNEKLSKADLTRILKKHFGVSNVIWLKHGALLGDDTDGHIDTLARFAPGNRLVYTKCHDEADEHFNELMLMEQELKRVRNAQGKRYNLCSVPLPTAIYYDDERLPASYVNYLVLNEKVLVPIYEVQEDSVALEAIADAHPGFSIIPINCVPLIRQHGSLHCATMNYPKGVF